MSSPRRLSLFLAVACGAAGAASRAFGGDDPAPGAPPPASAPVGPRPHIAFDRTSHDFGSVKQKSEQKTEFTVKNTGDAPLTIASLKGDCGCATATVSATEIAPGRSATISVVFSTHTFFGRQKKSIRVVSNDPETKETDLSLSLDVSSGIVLVPAYFATRAVLVGAVPTASVKAQWKEGAGKKFKVTGVECPELPDAVFTTKPFEVKPWSGFEITMSFKTPPPIGILLGRATIRTDDPENPMLVADVSALVSGRVVLSQRVVTFGHVREGVGGHREVTCRGFDKTIDLGPVTASSTSGVIKASAALDEKDTSQYVVDIRLPENTPPGAIVDFVEVRTKVPGEERLQIKVVGTVLPRTK
jgi:hypothetical protein